jgi:hypothetical protein
MRKLILILVTSAAVLLCSGFAMAEFGFDQHADYSLDSFGYYYGITGGLFPTGNSPNGDNASGGTFRWISDDPTWGSSYQPYDQWHKDDWFPENAGLALTLMSGDMIVYDNNGIEDGSGAELYDYSDATTYYPLLYRGYCMVNNYDWIYATYFKLNSETTFDKIIGYFDPTNGFIPNNLLIGYHMSFWSAYQDLPETKPTSYMPTVASFTGDGFDSLTTPGTFSVSYTEVDRIFPTSMDREPDPIWRLVYQLDAPVTLPAGVYFFSHNAVILGDCSEAKNHGQYVKCITKALVDAVKAGIITQEEMEERVSSEAQSDIGKPTPAGP